ncbi:MAG: TetR/AcrR family transcriptional regulator [Solirubrobacterales bacterium]|nr:TetR/AcrR family transcriptional regulator [Solirubrobacterales bacterium]
MIWSAALLMRKHGVEGTSFAEVIERSGAPRGSIYHHFPGGKAQLIEEATRYAGDFIAAGLTTALADDDPVRAIKEFASGWAALLRRSDFAAGCPVVSASLEGERTPGAREAAGEAFARWQEILCSALEPHVGDPERSNELATLVVASIEGAVVLARAKRSPEPLERVASALERMLERELQAPT